MMQRLAALIVLIIGGLIVTDVVTRSRANDVANAEMAAAAATDPAVAASPPRRAGIEIVAGAVPPAGTPSIDLQARLAIRQRIAREGMQVYLDSMFAGTDSTVVRWPGDPARELTIVLRPDTSVIGWNRAAMDDVRDAIRAWRTNDAGLTLREINDSAADITIRWVSYIDSSQTGLTTLQWNDDGEVRGASVTLALRQGRDSTVIPAAGRRRVAVHELGHALGLPHSGRDGDAMYPSSPQTAPSRRDQATLQLLYAIPYGPVRTP